MARFRNLDSFDYSFRDVLKWAFTLRPVAWPTWREFPQASPTPARAEGAALRVIFVNHSTVLLQHRGLNFLSDPHFGLRASPMEWAGPKRVHAPGLRFEDLPRIHAVLLSHDHYDHLHRPTLERLAREHGSAIYCGLGVSRALPSGARPRAVELAWWQGLPLASGLRLHFVPVRHFSGRGLLDRMRSLWGGFVLESPGGNFYFAGDTGWGRHFIEMRERFGGFRLALLPIGGYEPRWFMAQAHMNPEDAVAAMQVLDAGFVLGIHFGCFQLTTEGIDEPLVALEKALAAAGIAPRRFRALLPGGHWDVPIRATSSSCGA